MEIPEYPRFRPIEIGDRESFEAAFAARPPEISEFTFTNLYAWRAAYGFQVSRLGDFLILSSGDGDSRKFFRPIGAGNPKEPAARLAQEKIPFVRVPAGDALLMAEATGFRQEEDRANADYLYSVRELSELKGKKFDGKRNLIKKFKRLHRYEYVRLDGQTSRDCLDFQKIWCMLKDCEHEKSLLEEQEAVHEMCNNFSLFGLFGGAISVGGRISAVAVGQRLNADTMVMHILKALPDMPGLYQTMHNEFLLNEGAGYAYVNMEQDLGIEGLRKAKLSYQPVRLVEKFTLAPVLNFL